MWQVLLYLTQKVHDNNFSVTSFFISWDEDTYPNIIFRFLFESSAVLQYGVQATWCLCNRNGRYGKLVYSHQTRVLGEPHVRTVLLKGRTY